MENSFLFFAIVYLFKFPYIEHFTAVNKAVAAWRIVLVGRFRLLNQWCDFVEVGHIYCTR